MSKRFWHSRNVIQVGHVIVGYGRLDQLNHAMIGQGMSSTDARTCYPSRKVCSQLRMSRLGEGVQDGARERSQEPCLRLLSKSQRHHGYYWTRATPAASTTTIRSRSVTMDTTASWTTGGRRTLPRRGVPLGCYLIARTPQTGGPRAAFLYIWLASAGVAIADLR